MGERKWSLAFSFVFCLLWGCPSHSVRRDVRYYKKALSACQAASKRNPTRREPVLFEALIHEKLSQEGEAIRAHKRYLARFTSDGLGAYLERGEKTIKKHLPRTSLSGILAILDRKQNVVGKDLQFGGLKFGAIQWGLKKSPHTRKKDVKDVHLFSAALQLARLYRKRKKYQEMQAYYARAFVLGEEMRRHRVGVMDTGGAFRRDFAEVVFYLAEARRLLIQKERFQSILKKRKEKEAKNKPRVLAFDSIVLAGQSLVNDYIAVSKLAQREWSFAAAARQAETFALIGDKIHSSLPPKDLPKKLLGAFRREVGRMRIVYYKRSLKAHEKVLYKAFELNVFDLWVRRCESSYRKLRGKTLAKGAAYPSWWRRFQQRREAYVEPDPVRGQPLQFLRICQDI